MRTFPADITADDPVVTARSKYVLLQFGSSSKNCAHLVMTMSLEAHLSQLRAESSQDSSCATNMCAGCYHSPQTQRGNSAALDREDWLLSEHGGRRVRQSL